MKMFNQEEKKFLKKYQIDEEKIQQDDDADEYLKLLCLIGDLEQEEEKVIARSIKSKLDKLFKD